MKNQRLNLYISVIYVLALICAVVSFIFFKSDKFIFGDLQISYKSVILFIALEAFAESFPIKYSTLTISPAFAVTASAILNFGIFWAVVIVSIGVILRVIKHEGRYINIFNTPIYKLAFNMSNMTISTFCAGFVYYSFLGSINNSDVVVLLIKFILLSFSFLIVNTAIMSLLIHFISNNKLFKIFTTNFEIGFLNIIFVAPIGIVLAFLYSRYGIYGVSFVMIPIISLRYIIRIYV